MSFPRTESGGLSVELSSAPYGAAPGSRVEHIVHIRNTGLVDEDSPPVEITAPLTDATASSPGGSCEAITGGFRCEVGVVPSGGTIEVTVKGTVTGPADGFVRNTATLDGSRSFNGYLVDSTPAPLQVATSMTATSDTVAPWGQGLTVVLAGLLIAAYWRARRREHWIA